MQQHRYIRQLVLQLPRLYDFPHSYGDPNSRRYYYQIHPSSFRSTLSAVFDIKWLCLSNPHRLDVIEFRVATNHRLYLVLDLKEDVLIFFTFPLAVLTSIRRLVLYKVKCNLVYFSIGAFWFYCALASVGLILFYWLLPETKGRTLEEMEILFSRPRSCPRPWKMCRSEEDLKEEPTVGGGNAGQSSTAAASKNVQYVQIRGLNRDRKELDEDD